MQRAVVSSRRALSFWGGIGVRGDPLMDIGAMWGVEFVMKGGRRYDGLSAA